MGRAVSISCTTTSILLLVLAAAGDAAAQSEGIVISGMTFVATTGSVNELVLWAETATLDRIGKQAKLEQIQLTVTDVDRGSGFQLRCLRGVLDLASNDFRLEGEITGRVEGGRVFEADWVEYVEAEGLLYSDAPVVVRESGASYAGGGFRYHVRKREFHLVSGSRVVREP